MSGDRDISAGEAAAAKDRRLNGEGPGAGELAQRSPQEREKGLTAGTVEPFALASPSADDTGKSADELRLEVESARAELAGTVSELSERLDPRPKVEHAKERTVAAGKTTVRIGVPALAILALLAGLFYWLQER